MRHKNASVILLKPSTLMNRSGNAVRYWMQKEKITQENLLVITDDIAIPTGSMRLRAKGGDGGTTDWQASARPSGQMNMQGCASASATTSAGADR
jgi:peptidyl-tRNA hydrolase